MVIFGPWSSYPGVSGEEGGAHRDARTRTSAPHAMSRGLRAVGGRGHQVSDEQKRNPVAEIRIAIAQRGWLVGRVSRDEHEVVMRDGEEHSPLGHQEKARRIGWSGPKTETVLTRQAPCVCTHCRSSRRSTSTRSPGRRSLTLERAPRSTATSARDRGVRRPRARTVAAGSALEPRRDAFELSGPARRRQCYGDGDGDGWRRRLQQQRRDGDSDGDATATAGLAWRRRRYGDGSGDGDATATATATVYGYGGRPPDGSRQASENDPYRPIPEVK